MGAGRHDEAAPLYVRAAELAPESDELLFWAGLAHRAERATSSAGVDAVRARDRDSRGLARRCSTGSRRIRPRGERVRRELDSTG